MISIKCDICGAQWDGEECANKLSKRHNYAPVKDFESDVEIIRQVSKERAEFRLLDGRIVVADATIKLSQTVPFKDFSNMETIWSVDLCNDCLVAVATGAVKS